MTEINPPLKPSGEGKWSFPKFLLSSEGRRDSTNSLIPSFFARLGAFLGDVIALYALAYLANSAFRRQLMQLGPNSVFVALAAVLLYFTILNSSVGGGMTLGKRLLRLRVTGLVVGRGLSPCQVFKRALVQTLPFLAIQIFQYLLRAGDFSIRSTFALQILMDLALGLLVGSAMLVLLSATKRSFHDLAAQSIVIRATLPEEAAAPELEAIRESAPALPRFHRALVAAGVFLFVLTSAPMQIRSIRSGEWQNASERIRRLEDIIGDSTLEIRRHYVRDVPAGGVKAEEEEIQLLRERKPRRDGPRVAQNVMVLAAYRSLQSSEASGLSQNLKTKMPEIREWITDLAGERARLAREDKKQAESLKAHRERLNEMNIHHAQLETQVIEVLDFGIDFAGEPILKLRDDFSTAQMESLGIQVKRNEPVRASP